MRVLLTGAAGALGKVLRTRLNNCYETLRLSDLLPVEKPGVGEEIEQCDLADFDAVMALCKDCDAIIHLGGIATEDRFDKILDANIKGAYNLYEAARQNGVKRIIFASSNHTIGFYDRDTVIDGNVPLRPDSLYGVSKGFGEILARYYFDKFSIESVCIRIGSSFPKPVNRRMLATYLSYDDLAGLVKKALAADRIGFAIVYGASNNQQKWWDNRLVGYIGWEPQDSSAPFEHESQIADEIVDPNDPAIRYQGGAFAANGHFEDEN